MMRATLTFRIPDEMDEFEDAMNAGQFAVALSRIIRVCREAIEHPDSDDGEVRIAEEILDIASEVSNDC
jgi:hypothetical protein